MKTSSNPPAISGVLKKKQKNRNRFLTAQAWWWKRLLSARQSGRCGMYTGHTTDTCVCNPHRGALVHTLLKPGPGCHSLPRKPTPRRSCRFEWDPSAEALTPPQHRRPPEGSRHPRPEERPPRLLHTACRPCEAGDSAP